MHITYLYHGDCNLMVRSFTKLLCDLEGLLVSSSHSLFMLQDVILFISLSCMGMKHM